MLSDLRQPAVPADGSGLPDLRHRVDFVFELTRGRLRRHPAAAEGLPSGLWRTPGSRPARWQMTARPGWCMGICIRQCAAGRARAGSGCDRPRPCLGDPAFDTVGWMLAGGGGEAAVRNRIDRLAGYLDEMDADRVWAWCRGLAVVVAVSLLSRCADDQAGRDLLAIAAG